MNLPHFLSRRGSVRLGSVHEGKNTVYWVFGGYYDLAARPCCSIVIGEALFLRVS